MKRFGLPLAAMLLAASAPGLAQEIPGTGGGAPAWHGMDGRGDYGNHGPGAGGHRGMFASMSAPGRTIMMAAMRGIDMHVGRAKVAAARDRMLAVLDAERLDPVALRRALDDERAAVALQQAQHAKRQAAMVAGFEQLSLADRRAFVADARALRDRFEARIAAHQQSRTRAAAGVN